MPKSNLRVFMVSLLLSMAAVGHSTLLTQNTNTVTVTVPEDSPEDRYTRLTDADYQEVAEMLGVEIATIKAVSDIEAGRTHQGFVSPGKPLVNFELSMFRSRLKKAGIKESKYRKSHAVAFSSVNTKKYGSYGKAQWARLESASSISKKAAYESTFWGMFQIGGFNWKKCGASSVEDFVNQMSDSERRQLEIFAIFITNCDMVKHLKTRNWAAFARAYNGSGYAKRGYHTRMAQAYAKYKKGK